MTIAGSDSSCGAGIQADLRMFSARGVYGATIITALTSQSPREVTGVLGVEARFVKQQFDAVMASIPVAAIKTGMLWSAETIEVVASALDNHPLTPSVIDPVMIATSGAKLITDEAVDLYRTKLLPRCTLATPNLDEAQVLLDCSEITSAQLDNTAITLHERFGCAILLKGGHLHGDPIDVLYDGHTLTRWGHTRLNNVNTHGSGCMLSAAIAAELAKGQPLPAAVDTALTATNQALSSPLNVTAEIALAGIESARQIV
jgi:hydroxymethylpyrimidine/phosphomethylpyrimidine kinase